LEKVAVGIHKADQTCGISAAMIEMGLNDASLSVVHWPGDVAVSLYHQWLGSNVIVKILRTHEPFETALAATRRMLGMVAG
jgi:TetR/AcrR family transcriptional repressor of nem operon